MFKFSKLHSETGKNNESGDLKLSYSKLYSLRQLNGLFTNSDINANLKGESYQPLDVVF